MSSSPATDTGDAPTGRGSGNWFAGFVPRTMTSKLVATSIALVAVVSVAMIAFATYAFRHYVYERVDEQLDVASSNWAEAASHSPPNGELPQPPFARTYGAIYGEFDDIVRGVRLFADSRRDSVSQTALQQLNDLAADGEQKTIELDDLGRYRVVVNETGGRTLVTGVPLTDADETIARVVRFELPVAILATALAGIVGVALIRRQMAPLRAVAETAREVGDLPLESGDVEVTPRVPAELADPATEVGQVGEALNVLLDRVSDAFKARQASEDRVRQFVADASHELRTPLATIKGYAELSRRSGESDPATILHALGRVEGETERMSTLVDDLLLLARLDSGRPLERAPVDVSMLVVETVSDARVVTPDHQWRLDLPDEPLELMGDQQRLHQVLSNLVRNAARHTPSGTTVTVAASRPTAYTIAIVVHDDGPGLPTGLAEHAFERFARGDSSRTRESGGVGLGLSIVDAIVTAHGGRVAVQSAPGDTTFTVILPIQRPISNRHSDPTD